jgi:glycosyltransferase involved in cell wall biosynthesis
VRIGIDVRYLSHGLTGGVHTYVRAFVPSLLQRAHDHQIILYADAKRPLELDDVPDNVSVRVLPWRGPLSTVTNDLLFMPRLLAHDRLDVVHFPANYGLGPAGMRTVLTLHDSINILPIAEIVRGHPKRPSTIGTMSYLHFCSSASMRCASLVMTVSEHAREDITRVGRIAPSRIVVIPHGLAPDLRRIDDPSVLAEVRGRLGVPGPFVLADGLKNPDTLVRAWDIMPRGVRAGRQIVFFSRHATPPPAATRAVDRGFARLLIRPSRADLIALYSAAEAFVFPSWTEGFGLPLLEAMACGAPIVASDRGAIPEVTSGAALLADADDAGAFAKHLMRLLCTPEVAREMRERGFARASQFSWSATSAAILRCYEQAANSSSVARTAERGDQTPDRTVLGVGPIRW